MTQWVTQDRQGAADLDIRYDPVIITTWWGVADRAVVDGVFDAMEEVMRKAQRERRRLVYLSNVAQPGMPTAVVRKHMAERSKRIEDAYPDISVGSLVVMESDISRAALKAIQWLMNKGDSMIVVGTLAEAFKRAGDLMEAAGQRRPRLPNPSEYRPTSPLSKTG
ncbi:MAG: hypothetical protein K8H88_04955 [Sandaracinaceae bacterium]|nr:hypothetical protein [Sandaracinaceae bacterium]